MSSVGIHGVVLRGKGSAPGGGTVRRGNDNRTSLPCERSSGHPRSKKHATRALEPILARSSEPPPVMRRYALRLIPIAIAIIVVWFQFISSEKITNEAGRTTRLALSPEQEEVLGLQ